MSLTFVTPQTWSNSLHAAAPQKAQVAAKPLEVSLTASGTVMVGSIAAATVAVAASNRRSRGTQKTGSCVNLLAFENELGVQAPVGFWDPLGLAADGDVETFTRRRETEIKHGRISMLATMGYITPELIGKLPGMLSPTKGLAFSDIPNGLGAISKVPPSGWVQIVAYCAYCEVSGMNNRGDAPGEFGWKVLTSSDPEEKKKKLAAEIANGRLAMMAIIGMFFQDGLTGSAWGDWENYTDSPLRAFENELGVQAPVGFWDPLGLAADGNVETFTRRRETELKHGRISMLATMGYITPELTGKFPGNISPSKGVAFDSIPNGLGAISKVPALGWVQIFAYCAFCEYNGGANRGDAPGDFGWKVLTSDDPEELNKKLAAEIANGRLAMMAIIGMFFQDGLTGSAWGDWANYTDSPLRAFESELGVQAPVGFWDPLGLAKDGDVDTFNRRRESELKHGRISMLATMGYITPEVTGKLSGSLSWSQKLSFEDVPNGLKAISVVPTAGWIQILFFASFTEVSGIATRTDVNYAKPADFDFKILTSDDPNKRKRKLNAELANGRLAMMAIIGMFYQDGLTGSAWGDWDLYTDSPLRAFENELGVQAPVGYFDPLGLSKDGNAETFRRRRESELKHGRICMLATIGYFVTGLGFRFPGFLSPYKGIEFSGVPGGLEAINVVPFLGWAQVFFFCGLVEFGLYKQDPERAPGDFENGGILGVPNASGPMNDVEGRQRKLNAELANGRLAMVAIMGMMFQNGTVGSAGPEMWGS